MAIGKILRARGTTTPVSLNIHKHIHIWFHSRSPPNLSRLIQMQESLMRIPDSKQLHSNNLTLLHFICNSTGIFSSFLCAKVFTAMNFWGEQNSCFWYLYWKNCPISFTIANIPYPNEINNFTKTLQNTFQRRKIRGPKSPPQLTSSLWNPFYSLYHSNTARNFKDSLWWRLLEVTWTQDFWYR